MFLINKILNQNNILGTKTPFISFRGLIYFLTCLVLSHQLNAQNQKISFQHFGVEQGLSAFKINSIYQDQQGFMWFMTHQGLERYDGYNFKTYKYPLNPKLMESNVSGVITQDKTGYIWIASYNGGIEKFDPVSETFNNYLPDPKQAPTSYSNSVLEVYIDRNDELWVGTSDGLYKFNRNDKTFTSFKYEENNPYSIGHKVVNGIFEDKSGVLWIATGGGLDWLDRNTNKFYHYWHYADNLWEDPKTNMYWLQQIIEDDEGVLWIGTDGGLLKFDKRNKNFILYHPGAQTYNNMLKNIILSLCDDGMGRIWLGTFGGLGVFNKTTESFTYYTHDENDPNSLSNNNIVSIAFDKYGSLWVGTNFGGLNNLNRIDFPNPSFNKYINDPSDKRSFSLKEVYWISMDKEGKIWVNTPEGVGEFNLSKNKVIARHSISNNAFGFDKFGDLLFYPQSGGLYIYDKKDDSWICYIDSVNSKFSGAIIAANRGEEKILWLGNEHGELYSLNIQSKKLRFIKNIKGPIYTIYQDSYGLVWFGGPSTGLFCYNPETDSTKEYKSVAEDSTTPCDDSFFSLCESKDGTLWLGCRTGLVRFNRTKNNFTNFYGNNNFLQEIVRTIIEDDRGNLWLCTDNGISKFNPVSSQFKDFYSSRYFPEIMFYQGVGIKAENGEIYLGGKNGFIRFHPDSIKEDTFIPPIAITSFKKFEKPFPFGTEIELSHSDNFVSFEFAALSFIKSSENQYAYVMEGIDKAWIYSGTRRYASYPNMEPGEYVFKVKGSTCNGVWNEKGASLKIIITPPWWRTTWAYTGYAFVFLALLYSIRRFENNRIILKHRAELDHLEAEKLREVDQLKSSFFANISHEFRTPLTLIEGPAKQLSSDQYPAEVKENAGMIIRNTKRLIRLVNQLLDLSKIESGQMKLHLQKVDVVDIVRSITASFESLATNKEIGFTIVLPEEPIIGFFNKDAVQKIVSNLLSNAFKFTSDRGIVTIKLTSHSERIEESDHPIRDSSVTTHPQNNKDIKDFLYIEVTDTGIGIPEGELPYIFDRFYQVDASSIREQVGTGIGLSLSKELVELYGGEINVQSKVGKGSSFIVKLPLRREHLKSEDIVEMEGDGNIKQEIIYEEPQVEIQRITIPEKDSEESYDENLPLLLILEDNIDMRKYIRSDLEKGNRIIEAVNGDEGVQIAIKRVPDIIISDVMMPKMDGFQVCQKLKKDERTSHIPIILLTAKADRRIEGLEIGADDYITKPFDAKELEVRVKNLVEQRKKLRDKFRKEGTFKLKDDKITSVDEQFIDRAMNLVEQHIPDRSFTTDKFASEMFMSRMQLHRKMHGFIGHSPGEFVRKLRMEKAKHLLVHRAGTISEIAYQVGYEDPSRFADAFRSQFGVLPSEFLKQQFHT